jgi:Asp-tRNA(Asn)/Glu-tRNA(Gln) amidotransferase A subunit family amidase
MSLKDQFDIEGLDSTLGYVGRSFAPATSNATIVDVLKSLGAVVIAKTNLPQSIMVRLQYFCTGPAIDYDTVVRNRESSVGTDDASHEPCIHSWW